MLTAHQLIAIRSRLPGAIAEPAMGQGVEINGDGWTVFASQTGSGGAWEVYAAFRNVDDLHRKAIVAVSEALGC